MLLIGCACICDVRHNIAIDKKNPTTPKKERYVRNTLMMMFITEQTKSYIYNI